MFKRKIGNEILEKKKKKDKLKWESKILNGFPYLRSSEYKLEAK